MEIKTNNTRNKHAHRKKAHASCMCIQTNCRTSSPSCLSSGRADARTPSRTHHTNGSVGRPADNIAPMFAPFFVWARGRATHSSTAVLHLYTFILAAPSSTRLEHSSRGRGRSAGLTCSTLNSHVCVCVCVFHFACAKLTIRPLLARPRLNERV